MNLKLFLLVALGNLVTLSSQQQVYRSLDEQLNFDQFFEQDMD